MTVLRRPLSDDEPNPVLNHECPTKVREVQSTVGACGNFQRKVIRYDGVTQHGSRIRNDLAKRPDETESGKLLAACDGDVGLRDRIKPYFHLLRTDSWG